MGWRWDVANAMRGAYICCDCAGTALDGDGDSQDSPKSEISCPASLPQLMIALHSWVPKRSIKQEDDGGWFDGVPTASTQHRTLYSRLGSELVH